MQEVAALCDEIVIIAAGQVALHDSPDGIRNATGCEDLEEAFVKAIDMVEPGRVNTIRTVFFKEITDNFRDRRTLLTALLMGPLFGPILFAFVINLSVKQSLSNESEALDLPVIGQENAPNLVAYLQSSNINIKEGPATREDAIDAVTNGVHDVVIVIPETFGADPG